MINRDAGIHLVEQFAVARAGDLKKTKSAVCACCLAGVLLLLSSPVYAVSLYWDAASGDWFSPSNWNPAQVPQPAGGGYSGDDAFINNSGTAAADSATAPVGGIVSGHSIFVGGGDAGGSLSGSLTSSGVNIDAQFSLFSGFANAGTTNASGTISVTGADIFSGQSMNIGAISSSTSIASADGNIAVIGGDVTALFSLNIGSFHANTTDPAIVSDGSATGIVDVTGNVTAWIVAGRNFGGSSASSANGTLNVRDGDLTLRSRGISVGETSGGVGSVEGSANGLVVVDNGAISLSQSTSATSLYAGYAVGNTNAGITSGVIRTSAMRMDGGSFDDFIVGFASADGTASGSFASESGDVAIRGDFAVGQTYALNAGVPGATGIADFGTGSIIGVDDAAGLFSIGNTRTYGLFNDGLGTAIGDVSANGISGFGAYKIGVTEGTIHNTGNRAQGILRIGESGIRGIVDTNTGRPESDLFIGATLATPNNGEIFGPGSEAAGSVVVDGGSIVDMRYVGIGVSAAPAGQSGSGNGFATGSLTITNGNAMAEAMLVGFAHLDNSTLVAAVDAASAATGAFNMTGGTLTLQAPAIGSITNTAALQVGVASSYEPGSTPSGNSNPVNATGIVNLTDVDVVGNANLAIGNVLNSFTERNSNGTGTINVERGSVGISSIRMGDASGLGSVARAALNFVDSDLTVNDDVFIGSGGDAQAMFSSTNTGINIGGDLNIAAFRSSIGTGEVPETRGTLAMTNGLLDVGGNVVVGGQFQGGNGELLLDNVTGNIDGYLRLARSSNMGSLFGNGVIEMDSSTLAVNAGAMLDSGTLALTDSRMEVSGNLATEFFNTVDMTYASGFSADARIELQRSLIEVGGEFALGIDDVLQITLDGTSRGTGYGAIDTDTANLLGGTLAVDVGFALTENNYVFDLITSSSADGILGDFASLNVTGYDAGYSLFAGIVLDDIGLEFGPTEIYRLTLTRLDPVPVPGAVWLFGTGIIGLIGCARRKRASP
jgi:hypothetical protein